MTRSLFEKVNPTYRMTTDQAWGWDQSLQRPLRVCAEDGMGNFGICSPSGEMTLFPPRPGRGTQQSTMVIRSGFLGVVEKVSVQRCVSSLLLRVWH